MADHLPQPGEFFLQITEKLLKSHAYRALSHAEARILFDFLMAWNRATACGKQSLSGMPFSRSCCPGVSDKTLREGLRRMVQLGFIEVVSTRDGTATLYCYSNAWTQVEATTALKTGVTSTGVMGTEEPRQSLPRHPGNGYRATPVEMTAPSYKENPKDPEDGEIEEVCGEPEAVSPPPACSDFQESDSEPEPPEPGEDTVYLTFACAGKKTWELKASRLRKLYRVWAGQLDVLEECKRAWLWCDSNPSNRKTPKGMPAFLTRWMSNAVDRGKGAPPISKKEAKAKAQKWLEVQHKEAEQRRRERVAARREPGSPVSIADVVQSLGVAQ